MDNRFGFDGNEGLIFDRTKPCKDCDDGEDCGMFEEVTTEELIEHANSMESKLDSQRKDFASTLEAIIEAAQPGFSTDYPSVTTIAEAALVSMEQPK